MSAQPMEPSPIAAMGERALLATVEDVLAGYRTLRRDPLPGQLDLVPGAASLLVIIDRAVTAADRIALAARLATAAPAEAAAGTEPVVIDVCYDGADLAEVAELTGLSETAVITAHTGASWQVAFGGFAPGFAYLTCPDNRLVVPRRAEPRAEVPAGSVALAGPYSGIYPRASPGGWQLIGHTAVPLWDLARTPPALLEPGTRVAFRAVREQIFMTAPTATVPSTDISGAAALTVIRPGMQLLLQDLGRTGYASMGVSPSGAADRASAARANEMLGNDPGAALLEILFGGAVLRAEHSITLTLTGAPAPITIQLAAPALNPGTHGSPQNVPVSNPRTESDTWIRNRHVLGGGRLIELAAGETLKLGRPTIGLRSYLAIAGGFTAEPVLGSRATDLLSGLGPAPLAAGDTLFADLRHDSEPDSGPQRCFRSANPVINLGADQPADLPPAVPTDTPLDALPGPHWHLFADPQLLEHATWTVSTDSNRVGVRLTGPTLQRSDTAEIPSQGLVRGAIQVPPSGQPIIFLADHPVTGGYPVIAVLTESAADRAAQLRPGQTVRLATSI